MFRKMMIALLVLLQIAVPVGMAAYRPADEDVIREKGTRYTIALSAEGGLSYSSPSRVDAASDWRRITDREQASGRYAVLSTDGNGNVFVSSVSQKKPENGAYLLRSCRFLSTLQIDRDCRRSLRKSDGPGCGSIGK